MTILGVYESAITGTRVEKDITNISEGRYNKGRRVILPDSHRLKQLGVDWLECSYETNVENPSRRFALGKIIKITNAEGKEEVTYKELAQGTDKNGLKSIRNIIKTMLRNKTHIG